MTADKLNEQRTVRIGGELADSLKEYARWVSYETGVEISQGEALRAVALMGLQVWRETKRPKNGEHLR